MCGICGVVQIGGEPREVIAPHMLEQMTEIIRHRGPDDVGTYEAPGIALGVRRLSIVDVDAGHQPVTSEDGAVVAVQNGELYNHDEIRRELRGHGHTLTTRCDTEILPHLYEESGARFASRLHGKFGIAVWDRRARRVVLARDRLGVKPVYWAQVGDLVVFASELKCVLESRLVDPRIDVEAIDLLMTLGYVPAPRTPLLEVRKLRPGAILVVDESGAREEVYWEYPRPTPSGRERSLDECADELSALLRDAVSDRLMSDVPLGAMLSGGLDSSLIVAAMAAEMSDPVETFAVGFKEDPRNELADARRIADLFGCRHHDVELSVMEEALGLDELVWHMDKPVADLSALGFDVLCRVAAEHVTVALSGQGADELFGGYTKHRAASALQRLAWLPDVSKRLFADVPWPDDRLRRAARALAAPDPSRRLLAMSAQLDQDRRSALYRRASSVDPERVPGDRRRARRCQRGHAGVAPLPRRKARAGRRHAPLLRPRLDGALPGGASPVPRPPARGVGGHPARRRSRCSAA